MKVIFGFVDISEEEKGKCTSFVLKKDARYWWETVAAKRNIETMTCTEF